MTDEELMRLALAEADMAFALGEVPVGAVVAKDGQPMVLHQFKAGSKYKGPDGKIWWVPVVEVFDMRCFEWDGEKYIGEMVEIDPTSDYAKAMVEVK